MYTANHLDVRAIVALTESGSVALWMSRMRSDIPIYAFTRHAATQRRVTLYRGVYPVELRRHAPAPGADLRRDLRAPAQGRARGRGRPHHRHQGRVLGRLRRHQLHEDPQGPAAPAMRRPARILDLDPRHAGDRSRSSPSAAAWLVAAREPPATSRARRALAGLRAPVAIERDAAGVPVIRGATRADVARATGYAHAQDRLFQMDLLRRTGAGELAALLGAGLLDADRAHPPAPVQVAGARGARGCSIDGRADAARGLCRGRERGHRVARCAAVRVLAPRPDARRPGARRIRCSSSMRCGSTCRDSTTSDEQQRGRLAAALPERRLSPARSSPTRRARRRSTEAACPRRRCRRRKHTTCAHLDRALFERTLRSGARRRRIRARRGSNNWAVAGTRARAAARWLANDMHLRPARAEHLVSRATRRRPETGIDAHRRDAARALPAVIAGSNGRVAWGFTNSYGDFQDLVRRRAGRRCAEITSPPTGRAHSSVDTETYRSRGRRAGGARGARARSGVP